MKTLVNGLALEDRVRVYFGFSIIAIGLLLSAVSFYTEAYVFLAVVGEAGVIIAVIALESAKVASIVVNRANTLGIILLHPKSEYWIKVFRFTLLFISFLCTAFYVSGKLDKPHLDKVRNEDREIILSEYASRAREAGQQYDTMKANVKPNNQLESEYRAELEKLDMQYTPQLKVLERKIDLERSNYGSNRIYQGQVYRQLTQEHDELNSRYHAEKTRLKVVHEKALEANASALSKLEKEKDDSVLALETEKQAKLLSIEKNVYENDPRVNNRLIGSVINLGNILGLKIKEEAIALFFGVVLAVALELGIIVCSESAVSVFAPYMKEKHGIAI